MDLLADAVAMSDQYRDEIGRVSEARLLPGDEDTACRELITSKGHFVLKAYSDGDRCSTEISMLTQCRREGIPVPTLARTNRNLLSGAIGDIHYIVTRFIEGSLLPKYTHDSVSVVGRTLGAIHGIHLSTVQDPYYYTYEVFQNAVAKMRNEMGDISPLVHAGLEAAERIAKVSLPKHVTHCELRPRHLIQASNGEVYVLDFERAALEPRPFDLSRCFLFFCTRSRNAVDYGLCNTMYSEYCRSVVFSNEEKRVLYDYTLYNCALSLFQHSMLKAGPQSAKAVRFKAAMIQLTEDGPGRFNESVAPR